MTERTIQTTTRNGKTYVSCGPKDKHPSGIQVDLTLDLTQTLEEVLKRKMDIYKEGDITPMQFLEISTSACQTVCVGLLLTFAETKEDHGQDGEDFALGIIAQMNETMIHALKHHFTRYRAAKTQEAQQ